MDKLAIRFRLESLIGRETYRKFLLKLHGVCFAKSRLLYWQERLWDPFRQAHGLAELGYEEILGLFGYCHIHGEDLRPDRVPVFYGGRPAPDATAAEYALAAYPYANFAIIGPCRVDTSRCNEVLYCPACRDALIAETRRSWAPAGLSGAKAKRC